MASLPPALSALLQRDPAARAYYKTLPPDIRTAVCSQKVATLPQLKAVAEPIIHAP